MSTNETMSDKRPGSTRRKRKSSRTPLEEREADEDSDGRDPSDVDGSEKQRETHNQIEKRRREKMNSYINELSSLVPKCFQMNKKMDKLTILKLAVQHLKDLRGNPSDEEQLQMKPQFLANDELKYLILEAADGFLFVVSCDRGKLVYVSDSVYPILKQSQHDWIGKKIYDVIHPRDINRVKDQLLTADLPALTDSTETKSQPQMSAGSRRSFFCRMRCSPSVTNCIEEVGDGPSGPSEGAYYTVVHVTGYIKPWNMPSEVAELDDPDSESLCLVAIGRLQTTVAGHMETDTVPVAKEFMSRHSIDGKFSFVDQRVMEVLGFMPQELVGCSMYEFYHRDDVPRLAEDHKAVLNNSKSEAVESTYRFRNKSGQWVWLKSKFFGFRNPWSQQIDYILGHTVLVPRDRQAQISLAPRHSLPSPNTPGKASSTSSIVSSASSTPTVKEVTPAATQPSSSSSLALANGLPRSQRTSVIQQSPDAVPDVPSTPPSRRGSGFAFQTSASDMPSLSMVSSTPQAMTTVSATYGAPHTQPVMPIRHPQPEHFPEHQQQPQHFEDQTHKSQQQQQQQPQPQPQQQQQQQQAPSQRRVTAGQLVMSGNIHVDNHGQIQHFAQQTHHMTAYNHPHMTHSHPSPMMDFPARLQPSFSQQPLQSRYLSQQLFLPSNQTPSPPPWEQDKTVSDIVAQFFMESTREASNTPQSTYHHVSPSQHIPNQYQRHS